MDELMHQTWETQADFDSTLNDIRTQSDRGAAITGGAMLDCALKIAIEGQGPEMSNTMGKKSLSAKIAIASARGIIDESTAERCALIRHVRNEFAHNVKPMDFSTRQIVEFCTNLPDPDFLAGTAKLVPPRDLRARMRGRFIDAIYGLLLRLNLDQYNRA
jgi:hypothetical protein